MKKNLILIFLSLIFFNVAVLHILLIGQAQRYVLSMYVYYPNTFWISLVISLILASYLFINANKRNHQIIGLILVFLNYFILLMLPLFKDYFIYGGAGADAFSHLGYIVDIETTHQIYTDNVYPINHLFMIDLNYIAGISLRDVTFIMPMLFSIIFPFSIYLLGNQMFNERKKIAFFTLFFLPLFFNYYHLTIHPSFFSFFMIPYLLYFYIKAKENFSRALFLSMILIFTIVYFHPITSFYLIIVISTFFILNRLFYKIDKENMIVGSILIFLVISFLMWFFTNDGMKYPIIGIVRSFFFDNDRSSIANQYTNIISIADFTLFQLLHVIIVRYGFYLFEGTFFLVILYQMKKKREKIKFDLLSFNLLVLLIPAFVVSLGMILVYSIIINPVRASMLFFFVIVLFNAYLFTRMYNIIHKKLRKGLIVAGLIIIIFGVFTVYPSPITYQQNKQYTYSDFSGSVWIEANREVNNTVFSDYGFKLIRINHYTYGVKGGSGNIINEEPIPSNFGINSTFTNGIYQDNSYYILTYEGEIAHRIYPDNLRLKATKYSSEYYLAFVDRNNINSIYSNGYFEVLSSTE